MTKKPTWILPGLFMVMVLLVNGFGCQTPTATKSPTAAPAPSIVPLSLAPSTPAVSPANPVTPSAVQQSTTPTLTSTLKPSVPLKPASFVLGDLTITPTAVMVGEQVTYSIPVSNTGGTEGTYMVVFKYKGSGGAIGSDNVEVTLKPGETRTATFTKTQKESGTFFINVNDKAGQYIVNPVPMTIYAVPATSACAITSPPSSMSGINTHTNIFGTGSNPNMITLGPKLGSHPELPAYATHYGTTFELNTRGIPVLAPIDMVFVGFSNTSAEYRIQNGEKQTPYDDLMLFFESDSPDWPGMIIVAYHLYSSPLLLGHRQDPACSTCVEWGTSGQVKGHVFYPFDDYMITDKGNAAPCDALIGYKVKRGELIGFAGSVGTHSFTDICFKVSDTSENPTVQTGNRYLHWVQAASFFYWKSYSPGATFPSGVLAYPFECDGYQLPAEQRDVNFKYDARK